MRYLVTVVIMTAVGVIMTESNMDRGEWEIWLEVITANDVAQVMIMLQNYTEEEIKKFLNEAHSYQD